MPENAENQHCRQPYVRGDAQVALAGHVQACEHAKLHLRHKLRLGPLQDRLLQEILRRRLEGGHGIFTYAFVLLPCAHCTWLWLEVLG